MEFYLFYDGPLKASGSAIDKQALRDSFQTQMAILWQKAPLSQTPQYLAFPPERKVPSVIRKVGEFTFAPLVCQALSLICELDITFLRPEDPGSLITQGGDIDNRLKTLFDSLRMPRVLNEIPKGVIPNENGKPFFCLLEDDNLITRVNVATGRLLKENAGQNEVVLMIKVTTKTVQLMWANLGLG